MGKKLDEGLSDIDKEALRALLLKDGEVYEYSGSQEILSDADIKTLLDRYVLPGPCDAVDCPTNVVPGVILHTNRQRGATETPMCSRLSRRGRTVSRRRRQARWFSYAASGGFSRSWGALSWSYFC